MPRRKNDATLPSASQTRKLLSFQKKTNKTAQGVKIIDVSRPRVSDLVNAKPGRFSLDTLVTMLLRTGKTVELAVH